MTFDEFAAARLPAVLKFAAVLTGDRSLAEDVVQEVLIRANARWPVIESLPRPEAYVRKMIVNEYLAWRRRSWRLVLSGASSGIEVVPTPDPAAGYAEREAMLAELGKLPRRQRTVVVLRYYEGLSDREIADVLAPAPASARGLFRKWKKRRRGLPVADCDANWRRISTFFALTKLAFASISAMCSAIAWSKAGLKWPGRIAANGGVSSGDIQAPSRGLV